VECWRRLPNKFFFFGMLAAWLALFQFLGNSILGYIHTSSLFCGCVKPIGVPATRPTMTPRQFHPVFGRRAVLVEAKRVARAVVENLVAGLLILIAGMVLHILVMSATAAHLHCGAVHWNLWFDGAGLGARWLRKSFFPFFLFAFFDSFGRSSQVHYCPLQLLVSWLTAVTAHIVVSA